jgi:NTE family protein
MNDRQNRVSLVLGSGGARGYAHIGVIRAINEHGLQICNIAGTSMGAVVGGIYAAGHLDTYTEWASRLEKKDVVKLLDLSFTWKSIFKGERIFEVLKELIGDRRIEELDRGFVAVATALEEQREVWLNKGPLFQAIRASSAVPGVFAPVELEGRVLVDGGLVNPIPIAPTLNDTTDLTIAVNLNALEEPKRMVTKSRRPREEQDDSYRERIKQFLSEHVMPDGEQEEEANVSDILSKSIDVMQGAIARMKLATYAPDKVINIPRHACSFFEFDRAEEMADLGYEATRRALNDLSL